MKTTNVLVMMDDSYDVVAAVHTGVSSLTSTRDDKITIIAIIKAESQQQVVLTSIMDTLKLLKCSLHPSTKFNVFAIPETICLLESTIQKLVMKVQPRLMVLGLNGLYSAIVHSHTYRRAIIVHHIESSNHPVPDLENEDYLIRDSPRCLSPGAWEDDEEVF
ncbi:hypothetical protein BCR33DRAFT_717006 [Rhizoclosmatium globosum]|uniref:UspA domain-containing protein n=1 Tax=Rhizoclosmatium globosum TaxID=329046 RepID=A0A1Y2CBR8_9FUNG|nr:hypothetical protein BCR33DRAFT_717006 [Rhizoclosmatium globosum]|eukprot:ORY44501.1 hypothetical protein BCR33DRAFT_717006 [Rhizoclosmatium globosum]